MNTEEKLKILADAAKYDVACTSSGAQRSGKKGYTGSVSAAGCCHSFTADGRCVSLLKVLMTNACVYDCAYCVNRRSNDVPRAAFAPRELAELTMQFYRRNYIEGLFLSSAVMRSPDHTTEQIIGVLKLLRGEYGFRGYIHAKAIPGTDPLLIGQLGTLADRMSVNIELPSEKSLRLLAPDKTKEGILGSMKTISDGIRENSEALVKYRAAPRFARAGQSTQMIVGATPESDRQILGLAEGLYKKYGLKRVFFSAYIPVAEGRGLPSADTRPPLLREHRLYQADWLLRFYGFSAEEILDEAHPYFNTLMDPKCSWALGHMEHFPVEVNKEPYEMLLRVPGIGVKSARRIVAARRSASLDFDGLKKLGVTLKRAKYFITCRGKALPGLDMRPDVIAGELMSANAAIRERLPQAEQLSLFDSEEYGKCLTGQL
ncbi:MAG: putative DNA modification/repair radical SAM protein [Oscillospiraceae bacterium]|nr:putative DNA modification/repair radical SAM protein [Oscillospiraceae bacterium]